MNWYLIILGLFLILVSIGIFIGNEFCLNLIAGYKSCKDIQKKVIHKEKLDKVISVGFFIAGFLIFLEGIQKLSKNYGIVIGLIILLCTSAFVNLLLKNRL